MTEKTEELLVWFIENVHPCIYKGQFLGDKQEKQKLLSKLEEKIAEICEERKLEEQERKSEIQAGEEE